MFHLQCFSLNASQKNGATLVARVALHRGRDVIDLLFRLFVAHGAAACASSRSLVQLRCGPSLGGTDLLADALVGLANIVALKCCRV